MSLFSMMVGAFYQEILVTRYSSNSSTGEFVESEFLNSINTLGTKIFCFKQNDSSFLQSANF